MGRDGTRAQRAGSSRRGRGGVTGRGERRGRGRCRQVDALPGPFLLPSCPQPASLPRRRWETTRVPTEGGGGGGTAPTSPPGAGGVGSGCAVPPPPGGTGGPSWPIGPAPDRGPPFPQPSSSSFPHGLLRNKQAGGKQREPREGPASPPLLPRTAAAPGVPSRCKDSAPRPPGGRGVANPPGGLPQGLLLLLQPQPSGVSGPSPFFFFFFDLHISHH